MAGTLIENRKLWFDEEIQNRIAAFDDFAETEPDRNMIRIVFYFKDPRRRAPQIVVITQQEKIERLRSQQVGIGTITIASEVRSIREQTTPLKSRLIWS